jgi:catechol 2,3-dioxygenase-like lactoylglutathione lyase family enzyme
MSGLPITQIDHVSVLITDLERSRRFYRDILGLKEIAKPRTFDFSVLWFDLGNQQLHLLLKGRPDALSPRHFALRVADARQARAYFHRHGVALQEKFLSATLFRGDVKGRPAVIGAAPAMFTTG